MPETIVDFPPDWYASGKPLDTRAYQYEDGPLYVFTTYLSDDTSLYALLYPGGQRFARVRRATNWAVEERYSGRPPREHDRAEVGRAWNDVLTVAMGTARAGTLYDPQQL